MVAKVIQTVALPCTVMTSSTSAALMVSDVGTVMTSISAALMVSDIGTVMTCMHSIVSQVICVQGGNFSPTMVQLMPNHLHQIALLLSLVATSTRISCARTPSHKALVPSECVMMPWATAVEHVPWTVETLPIWHLHSSLIPPPQISQAELLRAMVSTQG